MRSMCKWLVLFAAGAGLMLAVGAQAAEVKIGVVDMAALLQKSPQAAAATAALHRKFDARSKALQEEQDKVKNLQDQINRNGAVMSASQLQGLQTQLDNLQQDLSQKQSDFSSDFNTQRNEELRTIQQAILKAVNEYAKAQGYNLIIGEGVFYADGSVDITNQVLAQLQKNFKAGGAATGSGN
ncbi:MAG: OmpH family outer membrane protein [Gammaproteobacteria bacterium]